MEFKKVKLGEVARVKNGYAFKSKDFTDYGIPIIKIKNICPPLINIEECNYVSEELYNQTSQYCILKGDILISMTGSGPNQMNSAVGKVGRYLLNRKALQNQRVGKIEIIDEQKYDKDFLYYYLSQKNILEYFVNNSTGSANQANISKKIIENLMVPDFLKSTQRKIAKILNTLDSKIEINNKIISNLESQAQAIFKSWFVDFEPFQDGNLVESDLEMIPEGWEVKSIGELLDFDIGGGWGKEKPQEKYLIPAYVIRGTDIPNSKLGYFNMDNYRYHTESNLKNRRLQVGDIIFESSGGSTNQDLGRMLLVTDELLNEYNNDIICASFCKLIRINDPSIRWFVCNLLEYSYRNKILTKYEVKSTGISNFSFTIFKDDFKIAVPNRKTMERYFNVTGNNINLSAKLGIQNTKLAELRDALLPKLMAGEIDVSNIKIEGEEVKNE